MSAILPAGGKPMNTNRSHQGSPAEKQIQSLEKQKQQLQKELKKVGEDKKLSPEERQNRTKDLQEKIQELEKQIQELRRQEAAQQKAEEPPEKETGTDELAKKLRHPPESDEYVPGNLLEASPVGLYQPTSAS